MPEVLTENGLEIGFVQVEFQRNCTVFELLEVIMTGKNEAGLGESENPFLEDVFGRSRRVE